MTTVLFVSVPNWNSLDFDTQADLLIHEGVRHLQKFLGIRFSNQEIQTLTWVLLKNPKIQPKDLPFISQRLAEHQGIAHFRTRYCQYSSKLNEYSKQIPNSVVTAFSAACENPLLATEANAAFNKVYIKISRDYSQPEDLHQLAQDVRRFTLEVDHATAVRNFENGTSRLVIPAIQFTIRIGNDLLKDCVNTRSPKKCDELIQQYQTLLDSRMIW